MKMYKLIITNTAKKDINDAVFYIKNNLNNITATNNLFDLTFEKILHLKEFPYSHQLADDKILSEFGVRYILIKNYIAFYIVSDDTVIVVRFLYAKRNWVNILKNTVISEL